MRLSFLILTLLIAKNNLCAQVTNSWSIDSTGIYYNSIDTLLKRISLEKRLDRVVINSDKIPDYHQEFPDSLDGIFVQVFDLDFKTKYLSPSDLYIDNFSMQLDKEIISLSFIIYHRPDKSLLTYGPGMWTFNYIYQPELKTYQLVKIINTLVNVHFYKKR